ncbi:hypothetical protein QTJ16_000342 [Diplocarpon rosae]|uniref:Oxidoreductase n=1 Tax=Diplocarpon rosae TaxID=946125 RepID=A0AAD9WF96_9HELO|nr:hypothetical protein QTJ16_000342 [Diplocarpon rosae]
MPNILIIGATRGLGASLANTYAAQNDTVVYGTTRKDTAPNNLHEKILWVKGIDLSVEGVGARLVNQLGSLGGGGGMIEGGVKGFDVVIINAGYFATEDFTSGPKWEEPLKMYTTSAISPPFIVHSLYHAKYLPSGSKVILVSSESGSITLRHELEGGGNYAHHASKAALNMVGRLLSLDLKEQGVIISIVHPGFMRTEMTAGVGFDKYWDDGGAVTPDEAAKTLVEWTKKLDLSKSGEYWAPRGPGDIGTAEVTLGQILPTPLQLPW